MHLPHRCLVGALLLLLPLPLLGQQGVGFSIGSRAYRSGPIAASDGDITIRPTRAVEYMAHVQLARARGVSVGVLLGGFTADLLTESPGVLSIGSKDFISGYGARLTAEIPMGTLSRGGVLGLQIEGGLETFLLKGAESQLRGVFSAGPALRLPLVAQWDLRLSALGGTLLASPFTADGLPDEVTNRNPWWITWRIGVVRRFGGR